MYAAIFGMFASVWFGMAQERPPKSWVAKLGIGSGLSFLVAGIGAYLAAKNWHAASSLNGSDYEVFGIIFATEVAAILIGSLILARLHKSAYISLWIAFVVAVHFIPLAIIFEDAWLYLLTALMIAGQLAAVRYANAKQIVLSVPVGAVTGIILWCFAVRGLILFVLHTS